MIRLGMDLGGLLPENSHREVCIAFEGEPGSGCEGRGVKVVLPEWARGLPREEVVLAALYLAARALGDHAAWAAYHLWALRLRREVSRRLAERLVREARVEPPPGPVDMAAYWRGRLRAVLAMEDLKPALVKVTPPRGKAERERLRVLLEGKRVRVRGRTYHVGGLVRRLGGEKLAPWVYLLPKTGLQGLLRELRERGVDYRVVLVGEALTLSVTQTPQREGAGRRRDNQSMS